MPPLRHAIFCFLSLPYAFYAFTIFFFAAADFAFFAAFLLLMPSLFFFSSFFFALIFRCLLAADYLRHYLLMLLPLSFDFSPLRLLATPLLLFLLS